MSTTNRIPCLLAAGALIAAGCHGHSATEPAPPAVAAEPLPTGIETITEADIRAHVATLAADDLAGRETNQPGARKAADYIAARFAAAGLTPMPGQDDFLVPYQLEEHGFDAAGTRASVAVGQQSRDLRAGTDFAPFYFSDPGTASAEVVFAGYGISAPELGHDDYANLDVNGKLVLVLRHTPNEKAEGSGAEELARHGAFIAKAMQAQQRGAVGMLLVTDPLHHQGGDDLRMNGQLALPEPPDADKAGTERQPQPPAAARGPFVALHISQAVAEELVAPSGKTLVDVQKAIDSGAAASTIALDGVKASLEVVKRDKPRPVTAHNVIGFVPGADPARADEWIVVGAHYDHLGAFSGQGDTIYNGADDNASGTTGMLELAEAFASLPTKPARSLLFIGFSGEEKGLLGSRAAIAQKILPLDKVVFMLNLDMIGRNPDKPIEVVGDGFASGLSKLVADASGALGINIELGGTDYAANSDHHPFFAEAVPVLFLFTGLHDDYHQLGDHADKLAYDNMHRVIKLAYGIAHGVASAETTPEFIHHISWLGIAVQVKQSGAEVIGVDADSRAAKAGFAVGDIITATGGEALAAADQIGERFAALEPGTKTAITVRRGATTTDIAVERAVRGYLGVMPRPVEDEQRKKLGLGDDEGVLIAGLADDGPAGKAGIVANDILIRIAGHPVGIRTLGRHLARIGAGEKVDIVVVRDGARVELELVLGQRPERPRRP